MKLRHKKTGEIGVLVNEPTGDNSQFVIYHPVIDGRVVNSQHTVYSSLAELNEEWEDYEEPKEWWIINDCGEIVRGKEYDEEIDGLSKSIGNYFETKEEAERAVEKLKAWKRLKDEGFKFDKWRARVEGGLSIIMRRDEYKGITDEDRQDLDLLFGGERC